MNSANKSPGQGLAPWPVLNLILGGFAMALFAGLILLTCVDIVARSWFNSPVNGAFELTQLMLAGLIFTALPITTATGEHVDVELLAEKAGYGTQKLLFVLAQCVAAVVLFALSWRLWAHALRLARDETVTNSLEISLAPIGYFAALSCALSGVISVLRLSHRWKSSGRLPE